MFFTFLSFIVILVVMDLLLPHPLAGESLLRQNLEIIPAMGYLSLAFIGTSVPLVTYRDRGTLLLLATTPLSRRDFLIGQIPVRAVIAAAEGIVVLLLMWLAGTRSPTALAYAAGTLIFGASMFLALGALCGARGRNVDLTMQLSLIAPIIIIATSGAVPLGMLPEWARATIGMLPSTWFMAALDGAERLSPTSILVAWFGLLAVTAAALAVAVGIFDWGVEKRFERRTL